ncbi:unnamed protein product [Polarella glacialis]|uniref:Uncharacterized protein n=1 Tax=Polarella glacialis TaxID=89957 RepID=A0A813I0I6_POLGL|nr:unnamed protein product [Polarella glacialis]
MNSLPKKITIILDGSCLCVGTCCCIPVAAERHSEDSASAASGVSQDGASSPSGNHRQGWFSSCLNPLTSRVEDDILTPRVLQNACHRAAAKQVLFRKSQSHSTFSISTCASEE